ncbi:MAG: TetR/AcrR family transcriptional regulator [Spirochaetaceae bacterium]|nr:MAG: TetR/AcrR family transcriptional regulator [Spirochaetaceae bacterium]
MPKAWSKHEKELVEQALRDEGRKLFERYGLQKTTVEEIARAAKISKGAFYLFHRSKEELYFRILEELEQEYHENVYGVLLHAEGPRRERFREFLRRTIEIMTTRPIYSQITTSDYEYLRRKLPDQTVEAHVKRDFEELGSRFGTWMDKGWMRRVDPRALNGLFLSLFYSIMHREDLGGVGFEAAKELWIDMVSTYLIPEQEER